jgi:hypothetical protein
MFTIAGQVKIFVALEPADMRRGFEGLSREGLRPLSLPSDQEQPRTRRDHKWLAHRGAKGINRLLCLL